jgi:hypothetical protein
MYAALTAKMGRMSINISLHLIAAPSQRPSYDTDFSKTAKSNYQLRHDYLYVSN